MNKLFVRIVGVTVLVALAFATGYFIGYENGKKEVLEYIHKDVPNFNDEEKGNTDPVI